MYTIFAQEHGRGNEAQMWEQDSTHIRRAKYCSPGTRVGWMRGGIER